jgi:hypothetical protein
VTLYDWAERKIGVCLVDEIGAQGFLWLSAVVEMLTGQEVETLWDGVEGRRNADRKSLA